MYMPGGGWCRLSAAWSGGISAGTARLHFVWLLRLQGAGPSSVPWAVLGLSQEESRSCEACRGLGWEVTQHHFCNVLLVKVSRRPTQMRRVEKEALPLDERNKVKACCKGACHGVRVGRACCKQGTTVSNPGPGSRILLQRAVAS